jgi:hypothetical protein
VCARSDPLTESEVGLSEDAQQRNYNLLSWSASSASPSHSATMHAQAPPPVLSPPLHAEGMHLSHEPHAFPSISGEAFSSGACVARACVLRWVSVSSLPLLVVAAACCGPAVFVVAEVLWHLGRGVWAPLRPRSSVRPPPRCSVLRFVVASYCALHGALGSVSSTLC